MELGLIYFVLYIVGFIITGVVIGIFWTQEEIEKVDTIFYIIFWPIVWILYTCSIIIAIPIFIGVWLKEFNR